MSNEQFFASEKNSKQEQKSQEPPQLDKKPSINLSQEQQSQEQTKLDQEWVLNQIKEATNKVLLDAKGEIAKQVQLDKASLITVFGIFASIISFLTIEFQFLKTVCSFQKILGFTMILSSILMNFNIALDYLVKSRMDKETPKPNQYFVIYIVMIMIAGVILSCFGNEQLCKENEVYHKYKESFESDFKKITNDVNSRILLQDLEIEKIKKYIPAKK